MYGQLAVRVATKMEERKTSGWSAAGVEFGIRAAFKVCVESVGGIVGEWAEVAEGRYQGCSTTRCIESVYLCRAGGVNGVGGITESGLTD